MSEFKTKAEVMEALDSMGITYPRFQSGAKIGKASGTLAKLNELYVDSSTTEKTITNDKPVFHRKRHSHNPMTGR